MKLLFNLTAVQPIHSAKFHGGGSYGEVIFWAILKKLGANAFEHLICIYDSKKYLDNSIINACKKHNIKLLDINIKSPQDYINEHAIDTFYTPLYSLEKRWQINVKRFVFTWHGVRALEMQYSFAGVSFVKKISQKLESLVRYRKLWKDYFYKPKYKELAARIAKGNVFAITVSEHSCASIKSFFPELAQKQIPIFYSPMIEYEPSGFLPKGVCEKKYFLLTSGARWEKNNLRAAQAFDALTSDADIFGTGLLPKDFKVVITGATNPKAYLQHLKHKERFVLLGYVENKELEFLHKNAYAFIFPSLNEGFGYPPVQSMRYGVPVAASGTTSIPEICGNAAIYFDPYSVSEIKNRIIQLLDANIYSTLAKRALERYKKVHERETSDLEKAVNFILDC